MPTQCSPLIFWEAVFTIKAFGDLQLSSVGGIVSAEKAPLKNDTFFKIMSIS